MSNSLIWYCYIFRALINLRKIGIARRGAKDTEEEENRYAQCYACVKMRKSCVAD